MNNVILQDKIKSLPLSSGVYLMKGAQGEVLYVGKAISLRKRVQSYFRKAGPAVSKTDLLVEAICDIDHLPTASEAEALILEASLIKQYHPKFNIELRDDKSYPFIEITAEEFPRVRIVRPHFKLSKKDGNSPYSVTDSDPASLSARGEQRNSSKYYGPYVNPKLIREALDIIRRIFHYRTCHPMPPKACLDFHIGLCDAPCINHMSREEYRKLIKNVCLILEGKKDELYRNLKSEMESLSKSQEFEKASRVRDQIRAIGALYSGTQDINYYKEAEQLQRSLNLPRLPERIEAFDISNTMGNQSVGAMVSFLNGHPDKRNYRRFRIRTVEGIDDFKMMAEIIRRRYSRLKAENAVFPDLIVVDGGKGQLSSAVWELRLLAVEIPIISLAKRQEEIFLPNKRNPIVLSPESLGLKLLQRIRDEVHRFAITYHRKLRGKKILE